MKIITPSIFIPITVLSSLQFGTLALSSPAKTAEITKYRLREALSSISGKPTLSPEIIIPQPTDPTALLLQATAINNLSTKLRTTAKANTALVSGKINALKIFCEEQEIARGNFPEPIPVIYCREGENQHEFDEIAEAGASAVISTLLEGKEIKSVDDIASEEKIGASFAAALDCGLQLIPELVLLPGSRWSEDDMTALIEATISKCGEEPAAILISVDTQEDKDMEEDSKNSVDGGELMLPTIPKSLTKKIPILGSVRVLAGDNRMGAAVDEIKNAGFSGAFLRSECAPGYRVNPDLDIVSKFWSAAISSLKSVKSKTFSFKTEVKLDRDLPMEWYKYQKTMIESGSLGTTTNDENPTDSNSGDYRGF